LEKSVEVPLWDEVSVKDFKAKSLGTRAGEKTWGKDLIIGIELIYLSRGLVVNRRFNHL
jgi:hypothetical protein